MLGGTLVALLVPGDAPCERFPLRAYGPAEGLPSSLVLGVMSDRRGFLWIATRDGVSRFDGLSFVHYGVEDGLPVPTVNGVAESPRDGHWIATNGAGVCWLDAGATPAAAGAGGLFTCREVGADLRSNRVNVVLERAGLVWAGTDGGLFARPAGGDEPFQPVPLPGLQRPGALVAVGSLVPDGEGGLWIGGLRTDTRATVLFRRLPDGRLVHYALPPGDKGLLGLPVLLARDGRVFVGQDRRVLAFRPEPATAIGPATVTVAVDAPTQIDLHAAVVALHEARDGQLWAGTHAGLVALDEAAQPPARALSDDTVTSLAEDRDGNVWMGTRARGIVKLLRGGLVTYDDADGLAAPDFHGIYEDGAGRLHVVSGDWMVSRFDGRRFTSARVPPPGGTREHFSHHAYLDHAGSWWAASREGIARYPVTARVEDLSGRRPLAVYTAAHDLPRSAFRFFEDSHGDLWLGSLRPRLYRWLRNSGRFVDLSGEPGSPFANRTPTAFVEDRAGAVWIGLLDGGLFRHDRGHYTAVAGAPQGITSLYADETGRLWVGSGQEGLARVDESQGPHPRVTARYTTAQGLASNNVRCLVSDRGGRLYLGTARGVDRLEPDTGRVRHLSTPDGLASGFVKTAFRDREGTLWFGTSGWLSRLVPRDEPTLPPPVRIAAVRVGGTLQPLPHLGRDDVAGLVLGPSTSDLQIEFFGLGFGPGPPLRFQYHLEGFASGWTAPAAERTVHFARPSPGRYRFQVRAVAADGTTSTQRATVSFAVLPPLWRRGWVQLSGALALGLLLAAAHRYRVTHLLAVERLRTRIAADLHDEIGSSLSRVAVLSEVVRQQAPPGQEVARRLEEMGETARGLIGSLGDIVWAVNPQRDDLGSLVRRLREFAGDMLEERGVLFAFQAPEDLDEVPLPPELRRHIFLVLKEALHNVARHAGASSAALRFDLADRQLRAEVRDDGRGFAGAAESAGHGLLNMRARAERIGGQLAVVSAPGAGTSVVLTVPLRRGSTNVLLRRRGR